MKYFVQAKNNVRNKEEVTTSAAQRASPNYGLRDLLFVKDVKMNVLLCKFCKYFTAQIF